MSLRTIAGPTPRPAPLEALLIDLPQGSHTDWTVSGEPLPVTPSSAPDEPIFVDRSGRRHRRSIWVGSAVVLFAIAFLLAVAAALPGPAGLGSVAFVPAAGKVVAHVRPSSEAVDSRVLALHPPRGVSGFRRHDHKRVRTQH